MQIRATVKWRQSLSLSRAAANRTYVIIPLARLPLPSSRNPLDLPEFQLPHSLPGRLRLPTLRARLIFTPRALLRPSRKGGRSSPSRFDTSTRLRWVVLLDIYMFCDFIGRYCRCFKCSARTHTQSHTHTHTQVKPPVPRRFRRIVFVVVRRRHHRSKCIRRPRQLRGGARKEKERMREWERVRTLYIRILPPTPPKWSWRHFIVPFFSRETSPGSEPVKSSKFSDGSPKRHSPFRILQPRYPNKSQLTATKCNNVLDFSLYMFRRECNFFLLR